MNAAGYTKLGHARFRVVADYAALGRVAVAASLGADGELGEAEVRRFAAAVIDRRERQRWQRAVARHGQQAYVEALALAIALIVAKARRADDAEDRQWGEDVRAAIIAFRAGETSAFSDLAIRNAQWVAS